jgi:hypothetical protein
MKRDEYILIACVYVLSIGLGFAWPLFQKQIIKNRKEAEAKLNEIISAEDRAANTETLISAEKQTANLFAGPPLKRAIVPHGPLQETLTNGGVPVNGSKAPAGTALSKNAERNNGPEKIPSADI